MVSIAADVHCRRYIARCRFYWISSYVPTAVARVVSQHLWTLSITSTGKGLLSDFEHEHLNQLRAVTWRGRGEGWRQGGGCCNPPPCVLAATMCKPGNFQLWHQACGYVSSRPRSGHSYIDKSWLVRRLRVTRITYGKTRRNRKLERVLFLSRFRLLSPECRWPLKGPVGCKNICVL